MEKRKRSNLLTILLSLAIIILFATTITLVSCGDTIEEEEPDPRIVGKVISFEEPMVYMLLSKKDARDWDKKSAKIGRRVLTRKDVDAPYSIFSEYPIEDIRIDMAFTIMSSYWLRGDFYTREFAPDVHSLVLKDENGILSTCSIRRIDEIDTNLSGELQ